MLSKIITVYANMNMVVSHLSNIKGGSHGCDRTVVGFITTCAICAYHHWIYEFEPRSWRGVLDTTLCDKVCLTVTCGRSVYILWFYAILNKWKHSYINYSF